MEHLIKEDLYTPDMIESWIKKDPDTSDEKPGFSSESDAAELSLVYYPIGLGHVAVLVKNPEKDDEQYFYWT